MTTFKLKCDKDLKDYLKESMNINVTIDWSKAISVDDFEKQELSSEEEEIVSQYKVIYIFAGEDRRGHDAIDVGQTRRRLEVRTKEHLRDKDYLEGYPYNQEVYCGKVETKISVDRDLLEHVEGIIIQTIVERAKKTDNYVCNDSKRKTYKSRYKIGHICNNNIPEQLKNILPVYIPEND